MMHGTMNVKHVKLCLGADRERIYALNVKYCCELKTLNMMTPRIIKIISDKWRQNLYLSKIFYKPKLIYTRLEDFAATEFNENFSGRQP
jgi:hypothetical protein